MLPKNATSFEGRFVSNHHIYWKDWSSLPTSLDLKSHIDKAWPQVCVSGFWNGSMAKKRVTLNVLLLCSQMQEDWNRARRKPVECCGQDSPLSSPWPIIIEIALTITLSHRSSLKQWAKWILLSLSCSGESFVKVIKIKDKKFEVK